MGSENESAKRATAPPFRVSIAADDNSKPYSIDPNLGISGAVLLSGVANITGSNNSVLSAPVDPGSEFAKTMIRNWGQEAEIRKLGTQVRELTEKYVSALAESHANKEKKEELENLRKEAEQKEKLSHILPKVELQARDFLLKNPEYAELFISKRSCNCFVMSVDLRKSTTLMLKARDPQKFADFIKELCNSLFEAVVGCHGVCDKFTGDGILAFFPDFFCGDNAGFFAVKAASLCHQMFQVQYRKHRDCFSSVLNDVGLGIGIDYGRVSLVSLGGDLTVVGVPVVYACRMGSAPSGITLLNQPAYEIIFNNYSAYCGFSEAEIDVKGEGSTIAYSVKLNAKEFLPSAPDWSALLEKSKTLKT